MSQNAGAAVVTVERQSSTVGVTSVNYATSDGTAGDGAVYVGQAGTLVFTIGQTSNTFVVPIINNNLVGGDKDFSIILYEPSATAQVLHPDMTTVTIFDDQAGLRFSKTAYDVMVNGVFATIRVERLGDTNSTVAITYSSHDGTAKAGVDYTAVSGTLIFGYGET